MTCLLICGDPHGQFQHILHQLEVQTVDGVILLGDLDLAAPLDQVFARVVPTVPIHWIPGNHDTDSEPAYDHLFGSAWARGNLHGTIMTIGGARVAGLGGVFRGKVWDGTSAPRFDSPADFLARCGKGNLWRNGLPLRHRSTIFPSDIAALREGSADILVTHEAPSAHPLGYAALASLATDLGVQCAFHGHHHETKTYPGNLWYGVGERHILKVELQPGGAAHVCSRVG